MHTDYDDVPLGADTFPLFRTGTTPAFDGDPWDADDEREELREIGRMLGFDI